MIFQKVEILLKSVISSTFALRLKGTFNEYFLTKFLFSLLSSIPPGEIQLNLTFFPTQYVAKNLVNDIKPPFAVLYLPHWKKFFILFFYLNKH